jgi:hypothetical protein
MLGGPPFSAGSQQVRAERKKWTGKCELCRIHRNIKKELHDIFRLRQDGGRHGLQPAAAAVIMSRCG